MKAIHQSLKNRCRLALRLSGLRFNLVLANNKHNTQSGMMKKFLAIAVIAPLLISCSSSTKKGDSYNEAWVKDTNGFDILMGQFAHNIENLWGFKEVLIAGPKDYVKYTDQYQTRSHINFDDGTITV